VDVCEAAGVIPVIDVGEEDALLPEFSEELVVAEVAPGLVIWDDWLAAIVAPGEFGVVLAVVRDWLPSVG
jgi:hypothetical protein